MAAVPAQRSAFLAVPSTRSLIKDYEEDHAILKKSIKNRNDFWKNDFKSAHYAAASAAFAFATLRWSWSCVCAQLKSLQVSRDVIASKPKDCFLQAMQIRPQTPGCEPCIVCSCAGGAGCGGIGCGGRCVCSCCDSEAGACSGMAFGLDKCPPGPTNSSQTNVKKLTRSHFDFFFISLRFRLNHFLEEEPRDSYMYCKYM